MENVCIGSRISHIYVHIFARNVLQMDFCVRREQKEQNKKKKKTAERKPIRSQNSH